jgi:prolyl oligopeptidase
MLSFIRSILWWVPEYGTAENKDQFAYLYRYSPYHHVEKGVKYPAVLFVTGDADTRVDPLHARKMTALMQSAIRSANPILLKYDTTAGHSGGQALEKEINDDTDIVAFLSHTLQ